MEQHQHYQSLQDQAYNALRSKIIYAELKPGTRLSAIGLEKETGIGRTPIRESFVRLREQELVETRPKSGTYVSKISMEHAENACFLREKLERSVLIKCCSASTPEQKHRLEQILAESESLEAVAQASPHRAQDMARLCPRGGPHEREPSVEDLRVVRRDR